ncbi:MAG: hypothetical protein H6818_13875 [Phycisphaerales bacterium]|nr:hypothetical protein [Phycisphaerales bacterium]MCB9862109.1 hypothetical protein [Phycisphaerales bacterium]
MSSTRIRRDKGKFIGMACLLFACVAGQCDPGVGSMVPGAQGPQGDPGPQGAQGETGAAGPAGADGSLRVYGDGSAGDRVVSSDEDWNSGPNQPLNLQFSNLTIDAGVTLTLPSGMTIRVTGDFANHGTIIVLPAADGGFAGLDGPGSSDDLSSVNVDPVAGIATLSAQAGEFGGNSDVQLAGRGGVGLSEFEARQLVAITTIAGGGGAVGGTDQEAGVTSNSGSKGGGALRILAMGTITNEAGGEIIANGDEGEGGGGGGGLVILASQTIVDNSGTIRANGGDGENGDSNEGPSGGGGGGIVQLLAPTVAGSGLIDVVGGSGGTPGSGVSATTRFAGGGGGASGGDGGNGGMVPAGANVMPNAAGDGEIGFSLITEVDPTALL